MSCACKTKEHKVNSTPIRVVTRTTIMIDEIEKANGKILDKYNFIAMKKIIDANIIPDILFNCESWKKEHNITKLQILNIIKINASQEFIEKNQLKGYIKCLANKYNLNKVNSLYLKFYNEYYDKIYTSSKENTIKQEEEWKKQEEIFDKMQEDRENHIIQCKEKFYQNAEEIQKKIDKMKEEKCNIQHAFTGKYGWNFCNENGRIFYNTALGPNYSVKANEEREKIIELFFSEHPQVKKGYLYKVDNPLPHSIYTSQGSLSSEKYAKHYSQGKWIYMADYAEVDKYGIIKDPEKYKSMIYDSTYYLRTFEDFIYYYRQKQDIPNNLRTDKQSGINNYYSWGGKYDINDPFNIIYDGMYQTEEIKKTKIFYEGWIRSRCSQKFIHNDIIVDKRRTYRQIYFKHTRSELKKEYNFLIQINKEEACEYDYNDWINTKGGCETRTQCTQVPTNCGVFKCKCIYHQRFNLSKYKFRLGHLYSDYYYSI